MITEGISNNRIQLVRRGDVLSKEASRHNASPGETVDNLTKKPGENLSPLALEETKQIDLSQKEDVNSKVAGMSPDAQEDAKTAIKNLVDNMNKKFDRTSLHLRFGTDEDSGLDYFQLYDRKNGDVIKQYPPEEMLDMVANLRDLTGFIFNENV